VVNYTLNFINQNRLLYIVKDSNKWVANHQRMLKIQEHQETELRLDQAHLKNQARSEDRAHHKRVLESQ
jgi:hypothetical protein